MLLGEVVVCKSSSDTSAHVQCLTLPHVDVDVNATLGDVQVTNYPTVVLTVAPTHL